MALLSVAEARAFVPQLRGTADDGAISVLVDVAGEALAAWLGWPPATAGAAPSIESASRTVYLSGPTPFDSSLLRLPFRPVTAVASVYDDPLHAFGSSTLVASSNYDLLGVEGTIRLKATATHAWSTDTPRAIKVTCTAGWSTIPPVLKHVAGQIVAFYLTNRNAIGTGAAPGGSIFIAGAGDRPSVPPSVFRLAAPYRLMEHGVG